MWDGGLGSIHITPPPPKTRLVRFVDEAGRLSQAGRMSKSTVVMGLISTGCSYPSAQGPLANGLEFRDCLLFSETCVESNDDTIMI